jgi:hypothetical protein
VGLDIEFERRLDKASHVNNQGANPGKGMQPESE